MIDEDSPVVERHADDRAETVAIRRAADEP
jgi:hypothetical protein